MPLLSSARKAEQFARLLEGQGASGGGEMSTLAQLATRLSAVPQPRPEFASALRQQLMSQATATLPAAGAGAAGAGSGGAAGAATSGGSAATSSAAATGSTAGSAVAGGAATGSSAFSAILSATAPVWAQIGALTAATAVAIGGVGLGASQSLPGQPLYGVKRQIETIQLELAGGRTDSALARLGFAHTRLDEISDLLAHRTAGQPLPAELRDRIAKLLADWAADTSSGTTVLLDRLQAGTGDVAAIRRTLTDFTDTQARSLALLVQKLPDAQLQSYTGSAFAYLQRVDTALGNPVHLATLLPSLGLDLPTTATSPVPTPAATAPTVGTPTTGSTPTNRPTSIPTLPIPTSSKTGGQKPRSVPTVPSLPTLPSGGGRTLPGQVGPAVGKTVNGVDQTVNGVLNGVTGKGPGLVLPTSVPTVPGVGH